VTSVEAAEITIIRIVRRRSELAAEIMNSNS
jgi:hypothetical protein